MGDSSQRPDQPAGQRTLPWATTSVAAASLLLAGVLFAMNRPLAAGVALVVFFALSALAARSSEKLRGFSFSLLIFACVTFAMCYPAPLVSWGEFQLNDLIVPLLQVIMFGMGAAMSARDFAAVARSPKAVLIGLVCQFTIMPFVGAGLVKVFHFDPEVAAGVILIGAAPSGLASNVMAYLAKANLALSVTLTTVATLIAPFITPFYMELLAGQYMPVDALAMMWSIVKITILPIVAGLLFNHFLYGRTGWLDRLMPKISMGGITMVLMIMTAGARDSLLEIGLALTLVALLHNVSGYVLGYWSCRALRLDEKTCRTIAFEVGLQNAGLANGLAKEMGKMATVGLAPTVFGTLMNITGASLATWWRDKPVPEDAPSVLPAEASAPAV